MVSGEYDPDASGSTLGAVHPSGRATPAANRTGNARVRPDPPPRAMLTPGAEEAGAWGDAGSDREVGADKEIGAAGPSGPGAGARSAASATTMATAGTAATATGIRDVGRAASVRSLHNRMCSCGTKSREGSGPDSCRASIRPFRRTRSYRAHPSHAVMCARNRSASSAATRLSSYSE